MCHIWLIHLLAVGHVDYFCFLPIMNKCYYELLYVSFCVNIYFQFSLVLGVDLSVFRVVILSLVILLRAECLPSDTLCHCITWPPRIWTLKKFIRHLLNIYVLVSVLAI